MSCAINQVQNDYSVTSVLDTGMFSYPFILFNYTTEFAGWYSSFQARVVGSSPLQCTDFLW